MIGKEMPLEEIVEKYPNLIKPLREYGIVCVQCGEPVWGTIGEQMDEKSLDNQDEIIDNINKLIEKEEE
ncbi:MAG: DUF1858 domain-containing protein [Candidatus Marinimicrobia bacterium]|nr:DUF1858 domain-containing protein [Candidatus Neomarinimicrobiota bacterium]